MDSALLRSSKRFLLALGIPSSELPSMAVEKGSVTCMVMKDRGTVMS